MLILAVVVGLGTSITLQDEQADFVAACQASIDKSKSVAFERCLKGQKQALITLKQLQRDGHGDIVKQCMDTDKAPAIALGQSRHYTNWARVEACTRAFF